MNNIMKKILYIAPYKTNSSLQISCYDIIQSLNQKNVDLTIRPLFIENITNNTNEQFIELQNKKLLNDYDIILQHGPIDLLYVPKIKRSKHIAIPLMSLTYNRTEYHNILSDFDDIFTDSTQFEYLLKDHYNIPQTKLFTYAGQYTNGQNIDLDIYNNHQKLYYIGNYYQNQENIKKILLSFLISFRHHDNIAIFFFLTGIKKDIIQTELRSLINSIKKELNIIPSEYDRIRFIPIETNMEVFKSIHQTCDTYINIFNDNYLSCINEYMATQCNNRTVNQLNIEQILCPQIYDGKYKSNEQTLSCTINGISKAIYNSVVELTPVDKNTNPTIPELLCL